MCLYLAGLLWGRGMPVAWRWHNTIELAGPVFLRGGGKKVVPHDLFIVKSPLPPKLGLRVMSSELNPTHVIDAFADHIRKMRPFL